MDVRKSEMHENKKTGKVRKNRGFLAKLTVFMVEISGIEPLLFVCLKDSQSKEKPRNPKTSRLFGGDKRDRTADLLNAIQALSQLSYTPIFGSLFQTASVL